MAKRPDLYTVVNLENDIYLFNVYALGYHIFVIKKGQSGAFFYIYIRGYICIVANLLGFMYMFS